MFVRLLAVMAAAALAGCAPIPSPAQLPDARAQGTALAQSCVGREGWSDAAPPARIFGNVYYVGTCGISVLLITSPQGHVLIDSATPEAVPSIIANIRILGFDPNDVRIIVGSHEHLDHMGGLAAFKAATGAQIWVSEAARPTIETGRTEPTDPIYGMFDPMTAVDVHGVVHDGEPLRIGDDAISLTPVATPGHTSGGTSWSWRACEGANCANIAYVDSLTMVSRDDYRFTDHPERVAPLRSTFVRVSNMPCDILITPHPDFSNLFERLSGTEPLVDRDACRRLVGRMRVRLDERLAREATP